MIDLSCFTKQTNTTNEKEKYELDDPFSPVVAVMKSDEMISSCFPNLIRILPVLS
ncbi:TPA: hypothetical protein QCX22_005889 [Bacillus toyonensis]|uniref:hypothetical protein n=1 Tax=Bacillus TaxID=1386 RepID=UPI001495EBAB|nr:hypothetical protein [Bacillus toyonensis]MCU5182213.1 hypothetical protein [Bacillus toyonensis]HDR7380592.1 hypothetical protein [Bacillus toyonensis]